MKVSLNREKGFVPSSRVDEIITNQYISCLLVGKESHSKNCENYYCDINNENLGKY
jgi:hypothetical protein